MENPNTQPELTHEEKWAEADADAAANLEDARRFYWKAAGRPHGPEEDYLPRDLRRHKQLEGEPL